MCSVLGRENLKKRSVHSTKENKKPTQSIKLSDIYLE